MAESAMIILEPNFQRHRESPDLFELAKISVRPLTEKIVQHIKTRDGNSPGTKYERQSVRPDELPIRGT